MSLTRTDTQPWYRQFWPWFIFGLPGIVVVAALTTVYIANRHADDLVVDDYYKEGLAINQRLEKQQSARDLGISASLELGAQQVTVLIDGAVDAQELQLAFSHPLEADQDFAVTVYRISATAFRASLPATVAPRWHWTLSPPEPARWRINGAVLAQDIKHGSEG